MSYRSRKQQKVYRKHTRGVKAAGVCEFCKIGPDSPQHVDETKSFRIIRNIFPYSLWDERKVLDHLMIIPKKHTDTLDDVTNEEAAEYVRLMGKYESQGYDVYARAPTSVMKSVPHQHTHLIKPQDKRVKFLLFIKKPYLRYRR